MVLDAMARSAAALPEMRDRAAQAGDRFLPAPALLTPPAGSVFVVFCTIIEWGGFGLLFAEHLSTASS